MFGMNVKEIDAIELDKWVSTPDHGFRVIDVRQMSEIAHGTVPKAEALPLSVLPAKIHEFSREEKLVMVCHSGARSAQACMFMQQQGFSNVYNLRGGMMGWVRSGFPAHRLA
ncbi:MAG: rhodanese-like domain-containing protein [Sideroxyarcus sp.]|nr:rhodanese-like domain-containing protein [Sideroxyarcus sp.]